MTRKTAARIFARSFFARSFAIFVFVVLNHLVDRGPFDLLVCFAQSTTVSGTVKDANGIPYAGALMKAQLVTTAGSPVSGQPTVTVNSQAQCVSAGMGSAPCQMPFQGTVGQFGLDNTGSFTVNLQDNTQVTPAATQWLFTVNSTGAPPPLGTGPQVCTQQVTISGATQTLNFSCPALSTAVNSPGPVFNIKAYGAVGDAKKTNTAVTSNGSSTITDATNSPWTIADLNKKIFCLGFQGNNALSSVISTISAFNSSSSISIAPAVGNNNSQASSVCVWFTQKDRSSMLAANTAAIQTAASRGVSNPIAFAYPSSVYCPPGGYVVDGPFFIQNSAAANSNGVSFIGAGRGSCMIYLSPDTTVSNTSWILNSTQNYGVNMTDFTVDCSFFPFNLAAPGMRFNGINKLSLNRVSLANCSNTGDTNGLIQFVNGNGITSDDLFIFTTGGSTSAEPPIVIQSNAGALFRNFTTSNPGPAPILILNTGTDGSAGGPRVNNGAGVTFLNCTFDEGATPGSVSLQASSANMIGCTFLTGGITSISVDGNSSLYLTDSNIAPFASSCGVGNTRNAITIAAGGIVYSTMSTLSGCGTDNTGLSSSVNGPSTATFVDVGGNELRNCTGTAPCPLVTAANYVRAYGGGIVPKATVTHTPNTCYAVTGNLLATAQNLCTILVDHAPSCFLRHLVAVLHLTPLSHGPG